MLTYRTRNSGTACDWAQAAVSGTHLNTHNAYFHFKDTVLNVKRLASSPAVIVSHDWLDTFPVSLRPLRLGGSFHNPRLRHAALDPCQMTTPAHLRRTKTGHHRMKDHF